MDIEKTWALLYIGTITKCFAHSQKLKVLSVQANVAEHKVAQDLISNRYEKLFRVAKKNATKAQSLQTWLIQTTLLYFSPWHSGMVKWGVLPTSTVLVHCGGRGTFSQTLKQSGAIKIKYIVLARNKVFKLTLLEFLAFGKDSFLDLGA